VPDVERRPKNFHRNQKKTGPAKGAGPLTEEFERRQPPPERAGENSYFVYGKFAAKSKVLITRVDLRM
jgi:hypothetical protein